MNESIFYFFYGLAHQSAFFDWVVIFFAVYLPYFLPFLIFIWLLFHYEVFGSEHPWLEFKKKWKEIFLVFFSAVLAWIVAKGLKIFFAIDRPFLSLSDVVPLFPEDGFAFPSQHSVFFSALAFAVFLNHKKAGIFLIFLAVLIGLSRIIGGVHFPLDILGGFILGWLIAFILKKI